MNRLRDYSGDGPVSERGIEMLRETAATAATPDLKHRVWNSLQQIPVEAAGVSMPGVKALVLGVMIFSVAGTAGAVITGRWIVPALDRVDTNAYAPAARTEHRRPVRRIATAPARDEAIAPAPAPVVVKAGPVKALRAPVAVHNSAASTQERTQVLDALVALRRDHDPVRAGALLEHYLGAHPHGALREEALVLATEAADARGDHALAQRLARSYQAEYPDGRFQEFARSHTRADSTRAASTRAASTIEQRSN